MKGLGTGFKRPKNLVYDVAEIPTANSRWSRNRRQGSTCSRLACLLFGDRLAEELCVAVGSELDWIPVIEMQENGIWKSSLRNKGISC